MRDIGIPVAKVTEAETLEDWHFVAFAILMRKRF
jgi:hypothetical protein